MGRVYYVPRSVKGEGRILMIFTVKSFIVTAIFAAIGYGFWALLNLILNLSVISALVFSIIFGIIGFLFVTIKIPDIPIMGVFRKAGGEYLSDIILRFLTFNRRKKIYLYNYDTDTRLKRGGK